MKKKFLVRREACRLAAIAMQGDCKEGDIAQRVWSLAVFFEQYMLTGAKGTRDDFGPKEPVKLEAVAGKSR